MAKSRTMIIWEKVGSAPLLFFSLCCLFIPNWPDRFRFFINSVNTTKTDLFSSSGEGKVTAVPDQASVTVGVTQQSQTVADAKNKVNQAANKIIQDLKKTGVGRQGY